MTYTIQETTVNQHPKLKESATRVAKLVETLKQYSDFEKVEKNEIAYKDETIAFIEALNKAVNDYAVACSTTEDVEYTDEQIVELTEEWQTLIQRETDLRNDGDINNVEDVKAFNEIVVRKNELKNIYDKLVAQGYKIE